jgi:hypothetical protein
MGFPNIRSFPESHPGPYERQMGRYIVGLLGVFAGSVRDTASQTQILKLAGMPARRSAAQAAFDEVRRRGLTAPAAKDEAQVWQYSFEESCCKAMYNATSPPDPFDPSSAFFVVAQALSLAQAVGIPLDLIAGAFPFSERDDIPQL